MVYSSTQKKLIFLMKIFHFANFNSLSLIKNSEAKIANRNLFTNIKLISKLFASVITNMLKLLLQLIGLISALPEKSLLEKFSKIQKMSKFIILLMGFFSIKIYAKNSSEPTFKAFNNQLPTSSEPPKVLNLEPVCKSQPKALITNFNVDVFYNCIVHPKESSSITPPPPKEDLKPKNYPIVLRKNESNFKHYLTCKRNIKFQQTKCDKKIAPKAISFQVLKAIKNENLKSLLQPNSSISLKDHIFNVLKELSNLEIKTLSQEFKDLKFLKYLQLIIDESKEYINLKTRKSSNLLHITSYLIKIKDIDSALAIVKVIDKSLFKQIAKIILIENLLSTGEYLLASNLSKELTAILAINSYEDHIHNLGYDYDVLKLSEFIIKNGHNFKKDLVYWLVYRLIKKNQYDKAFQIIKGKLNKVWNSIKSNLTEALEYNLYYFYLENERYKEVFEISKNLPLISEITYLKIFNGLLTIGEYDNALDITKKFSAISYFFNVAKVYIYKGLHFLFPKSF
jgi:hypothetical protein